MSVSVLISSRNLQIRRLPKRGQAHLTAPDAAGKINVEDPKETTAIPSHRHKGTWPIYENNRGITFPVLVRGAAVIMPDLSGLDITYCTSPRVMLCGRGSGQLNPFSSQATETEYRRSKNRFHVLTNRVESGLEFNSSSTPPGGQRRRIEGSITKAKSVYLIRRIFLTQR
ncbi:unnamed protein product [Schistocephalus solidus]|uniref:Uncharacterized protein n=1 Tax=Schistocephalus solidus TaxID=70667 RepID=A0A183T4B7_SCHSO|nr:unnamed protein product [Schistocephalus solidus]